MTALNPNDPMVRAQQNAAARALVLQSSVRMINSIGSVTVNPTNQNVINFQPRNVGLTLGFLVTVSGGVTNGGGTQANISPFGTANMLQQVTYTDLQNLQRIQTTGYHLSMLNSARQGFVFGGAYNAQLPIGFGNNFPIFSGPSTIAAAGTANLQHVYYVPLAYSANDLRGACYTNIVNATQNLQVVINKTPFVGAVPAADQLAAIYNSNAGGAWTNNVTVQVYQVYRDQIPFNNGVPILPLDDLNTVYDIKNTTITGAAVAQDFPFAYPNMRQFLSTFVVCDNGGSFNTGADLNYWSLQAANSTLLWKLDPLTAALFARQTFMADPPIGTYYFDHRDKPVDTITFGNMTLNANYITVNAGAKQVVCTEAFQQVNQIPYASSLAVGN